MVDISILTERGITSDRLKQIFTSEKGEDFKTKERIRDRIRTRVTRGIQENLVNYRYWWACDLAWDVPFRQTTSTLVRGLLDKGLRSEDILKTLEGTDISQMITFFDKDGNKLVGTTPPDKIATTKVNAPVFFHIFIPLCKAYTTIRAAAIVNSYRQVPLFMFPPARSTKKSRIKSDIITDRVEVMSTQYGYFEVIKEAVMHMLHYSQAILFPVEEWHHEKQLRREGGGIKEYVAREGIKFNIPHPSRVFFDQAHRPSTINSDTGVSYGGYWHVARYSDVASNKLYWNTDKVTTPGRDWKTDYPAFFNTLYNTCALKFSVPVDTDQRDREARVGFYSATEPDRAVTLAEYVECINPKTEKIGNYDYPVWFRYVVASDDTVMYAAPLPYNPMVYFGYDALETRSVNASMTLEILPFQDHISNLFTQYLLTIKQNLANITFFDTNQVDKATIDWIKNLGEERYVGQNFAPIDMRQNKIGQNNLAEAFKTFKFDRNNSFELINGANEVLKLLERVLVLSPQELAQSASHELTAEEVRNISQARSTRYEFTAGAVDRGVYAMKNLIYKGLMNYGDEDIYAALPLPVDKALLESLGFTIHEEDNGGDSVVVKGKISALSLESFASTRDGDLRVNNVAAASPMVQMLQIILGSPVLAQEVGTEQILEFMNEIAQISGLPSDFRFTATGLGQAQQVQMMQQQLAAMAEQIKTVTEKETLAVVDKSLKPVIGDLDNRISDMHEDLQMVIDKLVQTHAIPVENNSNPNESAVSGGVVNPAMAPIDSGAGPVALPEELPVGSPV